MRITLILLLLFPITSFGQFRGSNWAISDSILINFSSSGNTVSNSILHCTSDTLHDYVEPMATISDDSGNLLFYTDGFTIWNKENNVMVNGDSLLCDQSTTNGVLIIPVPNHDSLYFVFYLDGFGVTGLSYSVVNMNLNNKLGAVYKKNITLLNNISLCVKLAAVKHANGRDWWLVGHNATSSIFFKLLISPDSIYGPYWQNIGLTPDNLNQGEICFSPDGTRLAIVNGTSAEVFDFDRCSGELSNDIILGFNTNNPPSYYGCSFSPNATKIYISGPSTLYQFDLSNSNPKSTQTIIFNNSYYESSNIDSVYGISQHELAPDNKIYISMDYKFWPDATHYSFQDLNLSVINQPDSLGLACDFKPYSFYLGGHRTTSGLPNMPNYNLGPLVGSECDTVYTATATLKRTNSTLSIYPNPAQDELTIDISNNLTPQQITVTDNLGRVVLSVTPYKPKTELNISTLAAGLYFIKTRLNNGAMQVNKFVKQ